LTGKKPVMPSSEMLITLSIFAAAAATVAAMVILERRPRVDLTPRLIPTTPILLISGFIALLAFIHVVNLLGYHTGR
jgi:hypothetical protein